MKVFSLLEAICLVALMHHVTGFSTGAPPLACEDLVPQHKVPAKKGHSPYSITVSKKSIKAGDTIKLTITGKNGELFKGFMVQARVGETPVGHFQKTKETNIIDCNPGQQNTVTHTSADEKAKIEIIWVAPEKLAESVKFLCTIAKDGGTFWVAEPSESIQVN